MNREKNLFHPFPMVADGNRQPRAGRRHSCVVDEDCYTITESKGGRSPRSRFGLCEIGKQGMSG
jgi:hypothetical protein